MVKSHLKSPELMQAQIATFTAEHIGPYSDKDHIFHNMGALAASKAADVVRVLDRPDYRKEFQTEDNPSGRVEAGTELLVASGKDYVDFLRQAGGKNYDPIKKRAEMLDSYADFREIIAGLREELSDPSKRREHDAHIGNGSNADVFRIEKDGKNYAIRVPVGSKVQPEQIDSHMAASVLVNDLPHYEHIVAASYEDGVTVAELMPGHEVSRATPEEIAQVRDDQLSDLIDTLVAGDERGVIIDPKPSNFFYDSQEGFGIVDLASSKVLSPTTGKQTLSGKIGEASFAMSNMGVFKKPYEHGANEKLDYYAEGLQYAKAHKELLTRYKGLVSQKVEPITAEEAYKLIDQGIQAAEDTIETYSDPEWVSRNIAQNREYRLTREEEIRKRKERQASGWESTPVTHDFV